MRVVSKNGVEGSLALQEHQAGKTTSRTDKGDCDAPWTTSWTDCGSVKTSRMNSVGPRCSMAVEEGGKRRDKPGGKSTESKENERKGREEVDRKRRGSQRAKRARVGREAAGDGASWGGARRGGRASDALHGCFSSASYLGLDIRVAGGSSGQVQVTRAAYPGGLSADAGSSEVASATFTYVTGGRRAVPVAVQRMQGYGGSTWGRTTQCPPWKLTLQLACRCARNRRGALSRGALTACAVHVTSPPLQRAGRSQSAVREQRERPVAGEWGDGGRRYSNCPVAQSTAYRRALRCPTGGYVVGHKARYPVPRSVVGYRPSQRGAQALVKPRPSLRTTAWVGVSKCFLPSQQLSPRSSGPTRPCASATQQPDPGTPHPRATSPPTACSSSPLPALWPRRPNAPRRPSARHRRRRQRTGCCHGPAPPRLSRRLRRLRSN